MALYFDCGINKNALFQTTILVILPNGIIQSYSLALIKIIWLWFSD